MLDDIAGTYGSRLFVAAGGVAVALLVLVGILWLVRNRAPSPFVRGGKGRQQRLQVLDAAAIDARRRIVLIRRDGVEHLVMIGGPTDIVIESGIGDPARFPVAAPALAASSPVETITAREAPSQQRQLEAPPEPSRAIERRREPAALTSPPPAPPAAIKAPTPVVEPVLSAEPPRAAPIPVPPAAEPAYVAPVVEQPQPTSSVVRSEPTAPVMVEREQEAAAVDILDAARSRVLSTPPEQTREPNFSAAPRVPDLSPPAPMLVQDAYNESYDTPASVASFDTPNPVVVPPKKPGSDFESVLEAEMANTLTAERVVQTTRPLPTSRPEPSARAEPVAPQQRRDPDMAPIIGGDAALQKEVARIFGEMSVNREK